MPLDKMLFLGSMMSHMHNIQLHCAAESIADTLSATYDIFTLLSLLALCRSCLASTVLHV